MTKQLAGSARNVRFAGIQQLLVAALCAVAFAGLSPRGSRAQQLSYYDFNTPQATPGQSSTACNSIAGGPAANGVRFCLNNSGGGLSYSQDFYPPLIDPNASTDGGMGSANYTLQLTGPTGSQASSVWYSIPQNVKGGFTAWYAFKISNASSPTGDGFAFVIQNAAGNGTDLLTHCAESGSGLTALGGAGAAWATAESTIASRLRRTRSPTALIRGIADITTTTTTTSRCRLAGPDSPTRLPTMLPTPSVPWCQPVA